MLAGALKARKVPEERTAILRRRSLAAQLTLGMLIGASLWLWIAWKQGAESPFVVLTWLLFPGVVCSEMILGVHADEWRILTLSLPFNAMLWYGCARLLLRRTERQTQRPPGA